jgi:FdhD protein
VNPGEVVAVPRLCWRAGDLTSDTDTVVAEVPVALVYNGISHVVTMATPTHLEDLAMGFSLSEGILESPQQLLDLELRDREQGLELAMTITGGAFDALKRRRRNLTGRTGCGLCGLESLEQAIRPLPVVHCDYPVAHRALQQAVTALDAAQTLKRRTGGVHGAAWCTAGGTIELVREDVGRHNALDKLLGALQRTGHTPQGFALVTSRASYEMVAKVAGCGIPLLAAVSAPTSLAIALARQCGVTLAGYVQRGRQVIYTHPDRLQEET